MKYVTSLIAALLFATQAFALDAGDVATFDRRVITPDELHYYEDEQSLKPLRAFIEVQNFRPMSTPSGKRFAMVTVENQLDGRQILEPRDFVGIYADGMRTNPGFRSITLEPREIRTIVLPFDSHSFPLVKILIDNDED